jgi:TIR domain
MPVFISYSHSDAAFVNLLAAHLVKRNAHVWVDTWELNVGDSILTKVQQAIQESSALLVVLSKASVASEWCKKELNAGLMRELDEKRVVVLPVLVDDCEIPIFLREKMYADFRSNFDRGLKALVEAIARVTNLDQGRIQEGSTATDWAEDWGYEGRFFRMTYTLIQSSPDLKFTLLTEVVVKCNAPVTSRYKEYVEAGLDWMGRMVITEALADLADARDLRVILEDQHPKIIESRLQDSKLGATYDITIKCRRLGEDNGKDQLLNVSAYLKQIRDYGRQAARKPTPNELRRLAGMLAAR